MLPQIQEVVVVDLCASRTCFPLRYLALTNFVHVLLDGVAKFQASFVTKALFMSSIFLRPNPPPSLGVQIAPEAVRCS